MNKAALSKSPNSGQRDNAFHGVLQRKCHCGNKISSISECTSCKKKKNTLQRKSSDIGNRSSEIPNSVHSTLNSTGNPLSTNIRGFMESRFNQNFSDVRIHTDGAAAKSANDVGALAYTVGNHIAFNTGQYAPQTQRGKTLLAHELTHTLQQRASGNSLNTKLSIGSVNDAAEQQADQTADAVVTGKGHIPNIFSNSRPSLQRVCGSTAIGTRTECNDQDPNFISGHPIYKFLGGCDDFDTGEEARLRTDAATFPASGTIEIHGYASVDGNATFNENLSCARAIKALSVLSSAGFPIARTTIIKHGPTPGPTSDRRSVVIKSPTPSPTPPPAPLRVAFTPVQSPTTPAAANERIPPRVDTIVGVGISGFRIPMRPITLSIDGAGGGNGTATINGAATFDLSSTAAVRLRGVTQTAVGNAGNLSLVADQGGRRIAQSNTFSVSAIPQNHSISFSCLIGPGCPAPASAPRVRGLKVRHTWESDSNNISDLDKTDISERVEHDRSGGSLSSTTLFTSGYLGVGTTALIDSHGVTPSHSNGFLFLKQTQMFKDLRSNSVDIPVTRSGYTLGHSITPVPGTGVFGFFPDFQLTVTKFGATQTALGVRSAAGNGRVTRTQRI